MLLWRRWCRGRFEGGLAPSSTPTGGRCCCCCDIRLGSNLPAPSPTGAVVDAIGNPTTVEDAVAFEAVATPTPIPLLVLVFQVYLLLPLPLYTGLVSAPEVVVVVIVDVDVDVDVVFVNRPTS